MDRRHGCRPAAVDRPPYSLRVDAALEPFRAGQFGRLALEIGGEMVARPYSFVNAPHETPHEFYYIHLDQGPLTSRLTALAPGDRVFLAPRAAGFLTLAEVPEAKIWLLSTGTWDPSSPSSRPATHGSASPG